MSKIYIAGVNGSGKSTLLNLVAKERPEFVIIDSSKRFMDFLGFGGDYEKLRALSVSARDERLREFMAQVLESNKSSTLLFAGHPLNLIKGIVTKVDSSWMGGFDGIVLITADPQVVLDRIQSDSRDRELFLDGSNQLEVWSTYTDQYEKEVARLSQEFDLEYLKIDNNEGSQEESAHLLIEFVDQVK